MTRQKAIDLLAMSRFANLPTVWSNGLLGVIIGWGLFAQLGAKLDPVALLLLGLSLSCLYLGGCFFNDWHDLEFDRKTRPDRPIPSGRWSRRVILNLSLSLMGGGIALGALASLPSSLFCAGIMICILAYTRWHKVHPASFFFMAGARALIYPAAGFSLLSWDQFIAFDTNPAPLFVLTGLGLGSYILGISLTAKAETSKDPISDAKKNLPVACLCAPAFLMSGPLLLFRNGFALPPLLLFIGITAYSVRRLRSNHDVGGFVSRTLAAIPLVDLLLVVPLVPDKPVFWFICPVLALSALGLQKIAPAT